MTPNLTTFDQGYTPDSLSKRVLLFNPPVYDTRFPWSDRQQPVTLLQLATLLRRYQCDIRFMDALYTSSDATLVRRRIRILSRGDVSINYWRYGIPKSELTKRLSSLKKQGWQPDDVYIESFTTIWWEGVTEVIELIRKVFPLSRVILYGAYPSLAAEEAQSTCQADILVSGSIEGIAGLPIDLSFYPAHPNFTYLSIGTSSRSTQDLITEFLAKARCVNVKERIRHFAFADHNVICRFPEQFKGVLQTVIDRKLRVSFYALGNIYPRDIVDDPELASLLFRAGFKQIVFADDRDMSITKEAREAYLEACHRAVECCVAAGYRRRTESLSASLCIGRLGEELADVTSFMTRLAHVAGSLIVVPYQPSPAEYYSYYPEEKLSLELQNGKLFPFAEYNGASYRDYMDIVGLAAVFNAKYRSNSFDFLGDSLISRLVQSSLLTESWDPRNGSNEQQSQPVIAGWFNKEGRWVRS